MKQLQKAAAVVVALALLSYLAIDNASYPSQAAELVLPPREIFRSLSVSSDGGPPAVAPPPAEFSVCGRTAGSHLETSSLQRKYDSCPPVDPATPVLVLSGYDTHGRTGNLLQSLLLAFQYARDRDMRLAIMYDSWAMYSILEFFLADGNNGSADDDEWKARIESELCVEVVHHAEELNGRKVVLGSQKGIFYSTTKAPYEEYVASQLQVLRALFRNPNAGTGVDPLGKPAEDMCSGINALFGGDGGAEGAEGDDPRRAAMYSVVHLRSLEGTGGISMAKHVDRTGCDPTAALAMEPSYVKSILAPLGMLDRLIVAITDNQNKALLYRLAQDPEIGPMIRTVPKEACWFGGDVMLAVMANVFIGNPASTMSTFVAKSRAALGLGNNYMYRARNERCEWTTTCGEECLFGSPANHTRVIPSAPSQCEKVVLPTFRYKYKKGGAAMQWKEKAGGQEAKWRANAEYYKLKKIQKGKKA